MLSADCVGDRVPVRARGRVHSVFERACNIETDAGELVTLLAETLGNIPHGIRLAGATAPFESWLVPGQHAILENSMLRVPDAEVSIDLSAAALWCGKVAPVPSDSGGATIAMTLRALRATLYERAPEQGIASLLATRDGVNSAVARAFSARLSQALPMLARATERRDVSAVAAALARLVGLGPGLTPSGDDFIAGYLAALWSRAGCDRGIDAMLQPLADALAPLFLCTNAISRQMLSDAAHGRFAERLVDVTNALAGAGNVADATVHALANGHSSGADTLCGLLFGYAPDLAILAAPSPPHRAIQFHSGTGCTAAIV